ncbi:MAG: flavodoxin-dependent (E)-4-hydroxy-3-methylbut-2-enyl-diphosphate synthase [Deltaproteobacteria bacterium]|nr:flavodoxin-dependent (E)-4-hydroxy-3-methylbut-2-enyl-diphosphate synthase [Deltaproteobacteria bacterium]MBW2675942.1 flavodoxin-dependent (E)-4-hydroxy-3-methylbut-2-enyl-diphosphate synthase [Deltaproteobacteria bacterium]
MSFPINRKKTAKISIGDVEIGGTAPVAVQSMTNTATADVVATVSQIRRLTKAGCEIVRVAVPDEASAQAIRRIKQDIAIPLIADIHFNHRLAIASVEAGADGLRINPGNIGSRRKIKAVADCARDRDVPIRVGVNSGSLEKEILEKHGGATAEAMVESALRNVDILKSFDFDSIKVSIKASDVPRTVEAYRLFSSRTNIPVHLGVTEAGGLFPGIVKSSLGIGMLLAEGIGDTIRVSLTRDPVEEIRVGYEILKALGIRQRGPDIISCPTCGRCNIALFDIAEKIENRVINMTAPIKIAIMGCVVNGPGEAREADIGIAGGDGKGILFKKGKVVKSLPEEALADVLLKALDVYEDEYLKGKP